MLCAREAKGKPGLEIRWVPSPAGLPAALGRRCEEAAGLLGRKEEGWAVRALPGGAAGAAALLLPRSLGARPAARPRRARAQCSLLSPADCRSRRSPCLLLSGSQVRERSQLLFPPLIGDRSPRRVLRPSGGTHPATQTRSDLKLLWQLPERNVLLKGSRDHPHSSSCRHRCSADTS